MTKYSDMVGLFIGDDCSHGKMYTACVEFIRVIGEIYCENFMWQNGCTARRVEMYPCKSSLAS